jgi:hypothetical protein
MTVLLQDLRYAWRLLAKKHGFTTLAVLILALGIGANIAVYSVVRAILLNPLPFPHPEQLVRVYDDLRGSNARDVSMSVPEMYDLVAAAPLQCDADRLRNVRQRFRASRGRRVARVLCPGLASHPRRPARRSPR